MVDILSADLAAPHACVFGNLDRQKHAPDIWKLPAILFLLRGLNSFTVEDVV